MPLKKIVFLGVDNAGKSTILNVLSEKYSLISNQKPTVKVERRKMENLFGYDIINWDFPGQKQLREEYLKDIGRTLINTDLIMYIIDVQDYRRIMDSIKFFKLVINNLKKNDILNLPIFVLCHKLDPDVMNDETFLANIEIIKNEINAIVESSDINFFITTIYDRWSIFFAFSKVFKYLLPEAKGQKIRGILEEFAEKNGFKSILLMNEKNLVINEYSVDSFTSEIINSLALTLTTVYDIAVQKELGNHVKIDLLSGAAILIPIELPDNSSFFLLGYSDVLDPDLNIIGLEKTIKELNNIRNLSEID
ncbi:MAG: GTP-binding protein [Promethearchaeota archaeon]|nr:MAG: GTP-binding protein [Candidatus Lokiarchaeota archaeon]